MTRTRTRWVSDMAIRNALVQKVCFDDKGQAFLIRENISNTWYIVQPNGHPEDAKVMSLNEIRDSFKGFQSAISYANANRS